MRILRPQSAGLLFMAIVLMMSLSATALESTPVSLQATAEADLQEHFAGLEPGRKAIDGITFDVGANRLRVAPGQQRRVDLDPVSFGAIHFLNYTENAGNRIGSYELVYEDGTRVSLPVFGSVNIQDWWLTGTLDYAGQAYVTTFGGGQKVGFWRFSAHNPHLDKRLAAIEVANAGHWAVINMVAISLTDACGDSLNGVPVWTPGGEAETALIEKITAPDPLAAEMLECQRLILEGTVADIPALEAFLRRDRLSHAARLALQGMACPEAGDALRDALGDTTGPALAGIIESLGVRGEKRDVALLAPYLRSEDPLVAFGAAQALGNIGGSDAAKVLEESAVNGDLTVGRAVQDARLKCAESLQGEDEDFAHRLYAHVYEQAHDPQIRTAGYRGMISTGGDEAVGLTVTALKSADPALWDAALPLVRTLDARGATETFTELLDDVPDALVPSLVVALGQRGDRAATPAVAALVSVDDAKVRDAALDALGLIGDGTAVRALVHAGAHGSNADARKATWTLVRLNAPDVAKAVRRFARNADSDELVVLADTLGQRGDDWSRSVLRRVLTAQEEPVVRAAAIKALGQVGTARDAKLICKTAAESANALEVSAMEQALVSLGRRDDAEHLTDVVLAHLDTENLRLREALLKVSGRLSHPRLLEALGKAVRDDDPENRNAAVRALTESTDPAALDLLFDLAEEAPDLTTQVLALRAIARIVPSAEMDLAARENALRRGLAVAERAEEKQLLLSALASCPTPGALALCEEYVKTSATMTEAAMAWTSVAERLRASHPDLVAKSSERVLTHLRDGDASQELQDAVRALGNKEQ